MDKNRQTNIGTFDKINKWQTKAKQIIARHKAFTSKRQKKILKGVSVAERLERWRWYLCYSPTLGCLHSKYEARESHQWFVEREGGQPYYVAKPTYYLLTPSKQYPHLRLCWFISRPTNWSRWLAIFDFSLTMWDMLRGPDWLMAKCRTGC